MNQLRILGLAGSLRAQSYNAALLRAAVPLCPEGTTMELCEGIDALPLYNEDLDGPLPPAPVAELRRRIVEADAVLLVTPEHNRSIPAALKNALDWASRPLGAAAFTSKPVAVAGASPGALGTVRAQTVLRQVLTGIGADVVAEPEVLVGECQRRIRADGTLIDSTTSLLLRDLLAALASRTSSSTPLAS